MADPRGIRQLRLRGILRAMALGTALLAAACTTGPRVIPPSDRGPARPPTGPRPDTRPVQPGLPQDSQRHRVALLVPLTGPNAGVGKSLANATQLAVLDTKTDSVRITTYDTGPGATAAANQAIADGNRLILGPLLADEAREVAPIARRARVPVLSFSNDTNVAGGGTYLLGYSPAQSVERVVEHARKSGLTQFAALIPTGIYGERASTALLRSVESAGGKVLAMETYDNRPGSMTSAVTKLNRSPFQAVLIASSGGSAAVAVPIIRRSANGKTARILGTELWNTDSGLGSNKALNGAWFASVPDNYYRQYATKYRARFAAAPYRLSTLGYDSVILVVRIARDWRPGSEFPIARLTDRGGFSGLDGAFRFNRDGIAERALEVQEVRGGTVTTISPAPTDFGVN